MSNASKIARLDCPNPRNFHADYVEQLTPAVIKGAANIWPAMSKWSFAYLCDTIGERNAIIGGARLKWDNHKLSVSEFLKLVTDASPPADLPYLRGASIPRFYPELTADIQPALAISLPNRMTSPLLSRHVFGHADGKLGYPELFIGASGSGTPLLHYDVGYEHTFITQIVGDKEFLFFSPEQTANLYPHEQRPNQSCVTDPLNPDLSRFPLFSKALMHRITVHAGETVFIPSGWWHMSRLLMPSIAISQNAVSKVNWPQFSAYRCSQIANRSKRITLRYYLRLLGSLLSATETTPANE